MLRIRLSENFRAVFYAPFYATEALGCFASEGVQVELVDSPSPGAATAGLLDGSLDVSWGGPMRVMKARNEVAGPPLVAFCEVVRRDPFFLVARPGLPSFGLADLGHLRFASVNEVPTPWLCAPIIQAAASSPDRQGSSLKYSKLRPPRGERLIFTPGPRRT